jgi:tRNA(His) 5'-end guanylyltransferase
MFDCRVWSVPNEDEGANYFLWRERDATKNSISMAAQSMFSHTALQNKNGTEQMEMLFQAGTNWNHYPAFFKRGTYVRREVVKRPLTAAERAKLPAKHAVTLDPTLEVIRNHVVALDMPPIGQLLNKKDFLFRSIEPLKYPQDESLAELAC